MKLFIRISAIPFALLLSIFLKAQTVNTIYTDTIPLGGNAYTNGAEITDNGLVNWTDASTIISIYFRADVPQTFDIALRLQTSNGKSEISVSSNNTILKKQIEQTAFGVVHIGKLNVSTPGYVKIDLKGISKTGHVYADVSDLIIQYTKQDTGLVYVKNGSSFHFGRRGPSVHLRYEVPEELKNDICWFYNEITIPEDNDKLGSYFMADGFGEGYFGIQVNSETERRVLFSVWSPFETDDPHSIPDSLKIQLLKKGEAVNANNFGGEGSGGQSFMRFNWKAGNSYGFLLHAEPDSLHHTTTFTAYFKNIAAGKWYLIASFKRPQTITYLTHLYSFLENFIPETGDQARMGFYKNQWIANSKGEWHELTNVTFTVDATAKGGYRKDYAAGTDGDKFFLKNDGFFNEFVKPYQSFKRNASAKKLSIDFSHLP
ncbi:DUF3472 domain-containing protein [Parafilimonas sp.]|uniref:DUF3472 domain-containing protein n=1 Tax=Parafilimonas sp. TaxID=1969739 RepID=UPI0039E51E9C